MDVRCVWEHNGEDTLLYAIDFPGAYARGECLLAAQAKMEREIRSFCRWTGEKAPESIGIVISQDVPSALEIRDADSDVLFDFEAGPLSTEEYQKLKLLALRSAEDFLSLFSAVPDPDRSPLPFRSTFYGQVPRTAREMYLHTKSVNAYYFAEINVNADNEGTILDCRKRGFDLLEQNPDFLENTLFEGSYGECWTLKKLLRRFIWHDRIHARAMYRMALREFGKNQIPNVFSFDE